MPVILFVYGTLKRGQENHAFLQGQEWLGPARTQPCYRLYQCGSFPGLVEDSVNGHAIEGELWRIDEQVLQRLDVLEGAPLLFVRRPIAMASFAMPVLAYFYNQEVAACTDCGPVWLPS